MNTFEIGQEIIVDGKVCEIYKITPVDGEYAINVHIRERADPDISLDTTDVKITVTVKPESALSGDEFQTPEQATQKPGQTSS